MHECKTVCVCVGEILFWFAASGNEMERKSIEEKKAIKCVCLWTDWWLMMPISTSLVTRYRPFTCFTTFVSG